MKLTKSALRQMIKEESDKIKLQQKGMGKGKQAAELRAQASGVQKGEIGGDFTPIERSLVQQISQVITDIASAPDVDLGQYKAQLNTVMNRLKSLTGAELGGEERLLLKKQKSDSMSEMKLIMENWRQVIISEELSDIKNDAGEIEDLIKRASEEKDKSKIENTLQALLQDKDIRKAIESIEAFEEEVESQEQQNEGILDYISDKSMDAMEWANSDRGRELLRKGGKLLALALVAKALYALSQNDPNAIQALQAAGDVITASGEDVIEIVMGVTELMSESRKT